MRSGLLRHGEDLNVNKSIEIRRKRGYLANDKERKEYLSIRAKEEIAQEKVNSITNEKECQYVKKQKGTIYVNEKG